jgi:hypothetical protein
VGNPGDRPRDEFVGVFTSERDAVRALEARLHDWPPPEVDGDGDEVFGYVGFVEQGEFARVAVGGFDDEGLRPVVSWLPEWQSDADADAAADDIEWRADSRYGQKVIESPHAAVHR